MQCMQCNNFQSSAVNPLLLYIWNYSWNSCFFTFCPLGPSILFYFFACTNFYCFTFYHVEVQVNKL